MEIKGSILWTDGTNLMGKKPTDTVIDEDLSLFNCASKAVLKWLQQLLCWHSWTEKFFNHEGQPNSPITSDAKRKPVNIPLPPPNFYKPSENIPPLATHISSRWATFEEHIGTPKQVKRWALKWHTAFERSWTLVNFFSVLSAAPSI